MRENGSSINSILTKTSSFLFDCYLHVDHKKEVYCIEMAVERERNIVEWEKTQYSAVVVVGQSVIN